MCWKRRYINKYVVKLYSILQWNLVDNIFTPSTWLKEVLFGKGKLNSTLPLIVIGMTSLAAGIMSLWLPETRGVKLPDTIQDAIDIDRYAATQIFYKPLYYYILSWLILFSWYYLMYKKTPHKQTNKQQKHHQNKIWWTFNCYI